MTEQNDHIFTVNLTGLNLPKDKLNGINSAIQLAVMREIGPTDIAPKMGALVSIFHKPYCGLHYVPNVDNIFPKAS